MTKLPACKIPLNLFGVPFGIAGLAGAWSTAAAERWAPSGAGDALAIVSALAWLVVGALYARYAATTPGAIRDDLMDRATSPFASLAVIAPMVLAAQGLAPHAEGPARVVTDIFLILTVVLGGWFTGQWMYGGLVPFMPSTWVFAFSWAAVATTGLHWINAGSPTAPRIYGWLVLAAITVFIGGIGLRTAVAIARGRLLPPVPPVSPRARGSTSYLRLDALL